MRHELLIGDVFTNSARAVPKRTAVALGNRSMDFGTLEATSSQLAQRLESLGVEHGHRVGVWCSTTIDAAPLFGALAKLGALFIPLNGRLGAEEAQKVLDRCTPALLVVDEEHSGLAPRLSTTALGLEDLLEQSRHLDPDVQVVPSRRLSGADPHVVFYTSGSTGEPKGAVLSHETNYLRAHPGALLEPRGAMVCPYPLFHMGAWTIALQQWQARDAVVLVGSADATEICEAAARFAATRLNCIPAVWRRLLGVLSEDARSAAALESIRFADTGTSATPLELLEAIESALPRAHMRVFYGSTEAGSVASLDHADMRRKPGSCGVPGPGAKVRVDDRSELWVSTTTLFDGYLEDPRSTAEVLVDGWYRTGDNADLDDEGFLTITGRAGDLIRSGGESVAPSEVEAILSELSAVEEIAVVGIPDTTWGEVVCAVVVVADGFDPPTPGQLREHVGGRLAGYKLPRRVEVVERLPRTAATGQIQRRLLVEQLS